MMFWSNLLNPKRFREHVTVEKSPSDNRSAFKKDFDTVCNSTILRRLQDKAQVFPLEQEDYARTRLTHSIEAMSIAESLGFQVINTIDKQDPKYKYSENSDEESTQMLINGIPYILKTAALLHDMGNPPFGHLGEKIIGDWFKNNLGNLSFNSEKLLVYNTSAEPKETLEYMFKGQYAEDLKNFEGNAQLLRLVTKLSLVVDQYGMNLSFPVLASFIKYPTSSTQISKAKLITKKMGYFTSETKEFKEIEQSLGLDCCRHPLAFLLEAADDIAYLTADIEDAYRKKLLSLRKIREYFEPYKEDSIIKRVLEAMDTYSNIAKEMEYKDAEDYTIHRIRVLIKGLMIDSMSEAFEKSYADIMDGTFDKELIEVSSVSCIANVLRQIEKENIYYCDSILETKTRAIAVINKLLDVYIPAIVNWDEKNDSNTDSSNNLLYLSLSKNYRYVCKIANKKYPPTTKLSTQEFETMVYNKILLVTDQIAGMTDTHALTVYKTIMAN